MANIHEGLTGSPQPPAVKPTTVKGLMESAGYKKRFEDMLGQRSAGFISSVINAVNGNEMLKSADPNSVISSAVIAATMNLPIDQNLGFSAIVPYKTGGKVVAQFQMMWRGFVQLAIRSGSYETMNVSEVYEDEIEQYNPLTGEVFFTSADTWEHRFTEDTTKISGYYAYFKLLNGFKKELYMSKKQVEMHGQKYSKSYNSQYGKWKTDFDAMAKKTVIKLLLSKWGILSIDMQKAVEFDQAVVKDVGGEMKPEYVDGSGSFDVEYSVVTDPPAEEEKEPDNPFTQVK